MLIELFCFTNTCKVFWTKLCGKHVMNPMAILCTHLFYVQSENVSMHLLANDAQCMVEL